MTSNSVPNPVDVFIAYAREDEKLLDELHVHLATLRRQEVINVWHDRRIEAGQEWEKEIDDRISTFPVILLLISAHFIDSDYCYGREMKQAIERHERGEARVIPIICRPCDWKIDDLKKLNALPTDARAVTLSRPRDKAWINVAEGIRRVVQSITSQARANIGTVPSDPEPLDLETVVYTAMMQVVSAMNFRSWSATEAELHSRLQQIGISALETRETLRSLSNRGLLKFGLGGPVRLTPLGIEVGLRLAVQDYTDQVSRIRMAVCRLHPVSADRVANETEIPIGIVAHVIEDFENSKLLTRTIPKNHAPTMNLSADLCPRPVGLHMKEHEVLSRLVMRAAEHSEAFLPSILLGPSGDDKYPYFSVTTGSAPIPTSEREMLELGRNITQILVNQGYLLFESKNTFTMTPRLFQAYGYDVPM